MKLQNEHMKSLFDKSSRPSNVEASVTHYFAWIEPINKATLRLGLTFSDRRHNRNRARLGWSMISSRIAYSKDRIAPASRGPDRGARVPTAPRPIAQIRAQSLHSAAISGRSVVPPHR